MPVKGGKGFSSFAAMASMQADGNFNMGSCTGACATCPNRDKCTSVCSGACATCPNRDKCGFKTPAEHCPGTNSEQAGHASACEGCPNRKFCQSRNRFEPDEDTLAIRKRLQKVRHTVIVLSGKGGVGKSTFSAQLAFALAGHELTDEDKARMKHEAELRKPQHPELDGKTEEEIKAMKEQFEEEEEDLDDVNEWQVGLMDVDICGPSIPTMLGIENESIHGTSSGMTPAYVSDNLAAVSVGFLLDDEEDAVVWRGPKKNGMIKQFLRDVDWGDYGLDWLVVDTPPGTSDEHLSVVQYLKGYADGAIIVTSPQDVALADVRKEIMFCRKVNIPVIGVVENMSGFICPCCHKESTIFPKTSGGAEAMAKDMGIPFLGRIPLDPLIARSCDEGKPYFVAHPESEATKQFLKLFDGILAQLTAKTAV